MPLTINYIEREMKEIRMGKQPVADYYPPGATEPQVRPANVPADVPAPNENPEGVVTQGASVSNAVKEAKESFHEDVAKRGTKKAAKKR